MRFRSFGVSASNMEDFIFKLKEKEIEYLEDSTITQLNFTTLEEKNSSENKNYDDYALLGPKSNYKIQNIHKRRKIRKRQRIFLNF